MDIKNYNFHIKLSKRRERNLNMIKGLKGTLNYIIGYSDHTLRDKNMVNLTAAFLLGWLSKSTLH